MNPWRRDIFDLLRNALRFAMWLAIALIGLMFLSFTVWFVSQFLLHVYGYLKRTIFDQPW